MVQRLNYACQDATEGLTFPRWEGVRSADTTSELRGPEEVLCMEAESCAKARTLPAC
jgi:hypothetical protein